MEGSEDESPPSKKLKRDTAPAIEPHAEPIVSKNVNYWCKQLTKGVDGLVQVAALKRISDSVSTFHIPRDIFFEHKIIPVLIKFLKDKNHEVQQNAATILAYLSAGTLDEINIILKAGVLPVLSDLIISTNAGVCNQAVLTIANIISGGTDFRDICLQSGILNNLLKVDTRSFDLASALTVAMDVIFQTPFPPVGTINILLQKIAELIYYDNSDIRQSCLIILARIANQGPDYVKTVIENKFIPIITPLFKVLPLPIQIPVTWMFYNIFVAASTEIKDIDVTDVVKCLINQLSTPNSPSYIPAVYALGAFLSTGLEACHYCVHQGILETLTSFTKLVQPDSVKAVALLIYHLCFNYGSQLLPESSSTLFNFNFRIINNCGDGEALVSALHAIACFAEIQFKSIRLSDEIVETFLRLIDYLDKGVKEAALYAFSNIIVKCCHHMLKRGICKILGTINSLLNHDDVFIQEMALRFLGKAAEDDTKIQLIVSKNLIYPVVRLLNNEDYKIQALTAQLLNAITGNGREYIKPVVEAFAIPSLIRLLYSKNIDVRLATLGALKNITGCSTNLRDYSIKSGIVDPLSKIMDMHVSPDLLHQYVRVLFHLFIDPPPAYSDVKALLPSLLKVINHCGDTDLLVPCLKALSNASIKMPEAVQFIFREKLASRFIALMKHSDAEVQKAALIALDNVADSNINKQQLIVCGVLTRITELLKRQKEEKVIFQAILLLSTITSGSVHQIQAVVEQKTLISILTNLLNTANLELKREIIMIFAKSTLNGNPQQLTFIFKGVLLQHFFQFMMKCDVKTVLPFLEAFENICKKAGTVEFRQHVYASGGKTALTALYKRGNREIREKIGGCLIALDISIRFLPVIPNLL